MERQSVYAILGVSKTASDDEIKGVYRKLAVTYHPDKNPGDATAAQKFCEITEAYEKIRDPAKRSAYDLSLRTQPTAATAAPSSTGSAKASYDTADALRQFMNLFRNDTALRESFESTGSDPLQGENLQINFALTLRESALGVQKNCVIHHEMACKTCSGSGAENSRPVFTKCKKCGGHGVVRVVGITEVVTCPQCYGSRQDVQNACQTCKGSGRVSGSTKVSVNFPPGIGEGNFITLTGLGNAGIRNGKSGDLQISIEEIPDAQFRRLGYDLETDADIPLLTAVLGGTCMLLTLEGETVSLQIPPGTQPETLFSLKGLGLQHYKGTIKGNLYARVHVKIPQKLTDHEKDLYEALAQRKKTDREQPPVQPMVNNEDDDWVVRQQGDMWLINAGKRKFNIHLMELSEVISLLTSPNLQVGLDLRQLEFIVSMDLGILIKTGKAIQKNGGKMFLVAPQKPVREIIKETSIDAVFPIVEPPVC